jgi:ATP-binding cassette subfamily C protein CydCD
MLSPRLLRAAAAQRAALALTLLLSALASLLTVLQAWWLSAAIAQAFLRGAGLAELRPTLLGLLAAILARALCAGLAERTAAGLGIRLRTTLRQAVFDHLLALGPAYARGERAGGLVAAVVDGVESLDAYFSQFLPQLAAAALVPLLIWLAVFPRDWLAALILLVTAPLIPVFMRLIGRATEALTQRQVTRLRASSAHFLDVLQGLTTLKLLGQSRAQARAVGAASQAYGAATLAVLRLAFLSALVLEWVATLSTAVVAVAVALRLLHGQMDFQPALFILILAPEFYLPLRQLGLRFHAASTGVAAAQKLYALLDTPLPAGADDPGTPPDRTPGVAGGPPSVVFSHVHFAYDPAAPLLRGVSFTAPAGKVTALVGPSGAGKSTLAALLLRFASPSSGAIYAGGAPLAAWPLEDWPRQVAWVPQRPYLFHDTVLANLRLGRPGAALAEVQHAAEQAHLQAFVAGLPAGFDTLIGERGARLSGGQAQRLALARAFLQPAPLLILDEPTSSVDPELEAQLQAATARLLAPGGQPRTVLVIAHRLSTVYQADHIVVLDAGQVVEQGTHAELVARGGLYARLVAAAEPDAIITPASVAALSGKPPGSGPLSDQPASPDHISQRTSATTRVLVPTLIHEPFKRASAAAREPARPSPGGTPLPVGRSQTGLGGRIRANHPFRFLLSSLAPQAAWIALAALLGAATIASGLGLMAVSAYLLSAAALQPSIALLSVPIVAVRAFGLARGVLRYLERLVAHTVSLRLLTRLRVWFYTAVEPLAPAGLQSAHSADLLSRAVADVDLLQEFYVRAAAPPLAALLVAAGAAAWLWSFDPSLAAALLAGLALVGLALPALSGALARRPAAAAASARALLATLVVDGVQGLPDLAAFGQTARWSARLRSAGQALAAAQRRQAAVNALQTALGSLLSNLCLCLVLVLGIVLVAAARLPGVYLAALVLGAAAAFEAVLPLPAAAQALAQGLAAARRLVAFGAPAALPPSNPIAPAASEPAPPVGCRAKPGIPLLRARDLRFTYEPGQPPALDGLTFDLPAGRRVALVGPSGAGKTTLLNLLCGFWPYTHGELWLDGVERRAWEPEAARRRLAVVPQAPYFFNATLRDNLRLACPAASDADLAQALSQAQLQTFLAGLPAGLDTVVGEHGLRLSGGERQRLALARALLQQAPLLVLDEPTANLDPLTERGVLAALLSASAGPARAALLITHRLVGLEALDEILVLDRGRLVERGPHAALLAAGGLYARLWALQNRAFLPSQPGPAPVR